MAERRKTRRRAARTDVIEASSTLVGPAFTASAAAASVLASLDGPPIDFQARQDSISPTRRSPGPKLAPKVKRTTAKPSKAKETEVKL